MPPSVLPFVGTHEVCELLCYPRGIDGNRRGIILDIVLYDET